jgi:hypothetical protein
VGVNPFLISELFSMEVESRHAGCTNGALRALQIAGIGSLEKGQRVAAGEP